MELLEFLVALLVKYTGMTDAQAFDLVGGMILWSAPLTVAAVFVLIWLMDWAERRRDGEAR